GRPRRPTRPTCAAPTPCAPASAPTPPTCPAPRCARRRRPMPATRRRRRLSRTERLLLTRELCPTLPSEQRLREGRVPIRRGGPRPLVSPASRGLGARRATPP